MFVTVKSLPIAKEYLKGTVAIVIMQLSWVTICSYGFVTFDTAEEASKVQEQVIFTIKCRVVITLDITVAIKYFLKEFTLQAIM